mmetsp:Transcript_10362/g.26546  ORF Transcript_10362/g.26546 Transcript_10362/m.26546 type:complete len:129 (+) Transcript_10362:314-700(+)|eukprot:CAMPEP_0182924830 /NCGR_PEP_ID=MMETSP0105_2-20130417/7665_1 /TAXON_ID=81532 ORGANISM="Acanthoeca-like sp., Strain 10tr" /NCGR_SAMPLE_ID=MMETSP0105_2 /ASSEMBLY_ACC=CAM_ASM_000205 /LENGTH=128 /DNA_ID=CAMNT_0025062643 /DNA_START=314 /DNA_END=700 /DNA_ORIENTATION=+
MASGPKRMEDSHRHLVSPEEGLRKVEVDVVIPKMMKKEAIRRCDSAVKAFTECCRGRTISIVWACSEINKQLDECLRKTMTDADFMLAKADFLKQREAHAQKEAAKYAKMDEARAAAVAAATQSATTQ